MTEFFTAARLDAALKSGNSTDPEIMGLVKTARKLANSRPIPPLPKGDFSAARNVFLAQAAAMAPQASIPNIPQPKTTWIYRVQQAFQELGGRAWVPVTAVVTLILVLFATFGLSNLNNTAQASLPGDPLYTYKIVREDIAAIFTFDANKKVMVYIDFIEERKDEIICLSEEGQAPSIGTVNRLEKHLQSALKAASLLPDAEMQASLTEIRNASEAVSNTIALVKPEPQDSNTDLGSTISFEQAENAAKNTVALADQGLRDPEGFRVNMAAPKPGITSPPPTSTAIVVYPPIEPTPVVLWPMPTLGVMNPPLVQPTPTCPCTPTETIQEPFTPTSTPTEVVQPTNTNPPPVYPTPTELYIQPTQAVPTPTPTPTPTSTQMPQPPTPTPVQMKDGE